MAFSKKGLRSIIVNEKKFYWKFNGKVIVNFDENKSGLLIIDFGWFDEWLFINDKSRRPPDFEPKTVTPKFVSESILFAISEGWEEGEMQLEFKNQVYKKKK